MDKRKSKCKKTNRFELLIEHGKWRSFPCVGDDTETVETFLEMDFFWGSWLEMSIVISVLASCFTVCLSLTLSLSPSVSLSLPFVYHLLIYLTISWSISFISSTYIPLSRSQTKLSKRKKEKKTKLIWFVHTGQSPALLHCTKRKVKQKKNPKHKME